MMRLAIGLLFALSVWAQYTPPSGGSSTSPGTPVNSVQFNSPLGTFAGSSSLTYLTNIVGVAIQTVGTGLNDLTCTGPYTDGVANPNTILSFQIAVAGATDSFKWKKNSGAFSGNIAMTGVPQGITDGISCTWAATTGHTLNDTWIVSTTQNLQIGFAPPKIEGPSNSNSVTLNTQAASEWVVASPDSFANFSQAVLQGYFISAGTVTSPANLDLSVTPNNTLEQRDVLAFLGGSYGSGISETLVLQSSGQFFKRWTLTNSSGQSFSLTFNSANGGTLTLPMGVQTTATAVASLPTCNAGLEGAHAAVNNSNAASFTVGIGAVVAGGGTTHVPVYCDGTNWRIG